MAPAPPPTPDWQPAPAEGEFIPAGAPGSNWVSPAADNGSNEPDDEASEAQAAEPRTPAHTAPEPPSAPAPPVMAPPVAGARAARHAGAAQEDAESARRARHYAAGVDPGKGPDPTLATPPSPTRDEPRSARHRPPQDEPDEPLDSDGQHADGQPISELLARLQAGATGGGRRRRREE